MTASVKEHEYGWPEQQEWILKILNQKFQEQEIAIQNMLNIALDWEELPRETPRQNWATNAPMGSSTQLLLGKSLEAVADEPIDGDQSEAKMTTTSTRKGIASLGKAVEREVSQPAPPVRKFVEGPLDAWMGLIVCIHLGLMIAMTQMEEETLRYTLGLSAAPSASESWAPDFFLSAEIVFFGIYLLDVLVRIYVLHTHWYYYPLEGGIMWMNLFDAFLVLLSAFELWLLPLASGGQTQEKHTRSIRVIKLFRIVRTLRVVKTVAAFRQLRMLVKTCVASIGALGWSMVLLLLLKLSFALAICQALQGYIQDETENYESRMELYVFYGSFSRALYTMFEITHSGSWPSRVRPVVDRVSAWYAIAFLGYITLVVFAVIRIVTALFLKETLESTANDADILIESQRHDANKLRHRLETLFEALDEDGDGMLSPEEFESAMSLTSVQQYMQALDVRMSDCQCLFTILDDGDGRITIAEFCKGLKQVKGQARAIDMVVLQHETDKVMKECKEIRRELQARSFFKPTSFAHVTARV